MAPGTDVQAQAISAGLRPVEGGISWSYDAPEHWANLNTAAGSVPVPSEQGAYQDYYSEFAAALPGAANFPVATEQAVHTFDMVLDTARTSAAGNRVADLPQD